MNNFLRGAIIAIVVVAAAGAFYMKERTGNRPEDSAPVDAGAETAVAEDIATDATPAKDTPKLLCFGAERCVPCRMMVPVRKALAEEYPDTLAVEFVDVWQDRAAGQRHGIRVIPTALFMDAEGKEQYRQEGFMDKETIEAKFKELGIDLAASAENAS